MNLKEAAERVLDSHAYQDHSSGPTCICVPSDSWTKALDLARFVAALDASVTGEVVDAAERVRRVIHDGEKPTDVYRQWIPPIHDEDKGRWFDGEELIAASLLARDDRTITLAALPIIAKLREGT